MQDDWQQLQRYVARREGADAAFAAIVGRYLNLVFSAALRQVNDRSAAEEVTQAVFILLAEKAPQLRPTGSLGGWLYSAASLKAKEHLRSELARRRREHKAHEMSNTDRSSRDDDALDWDRVAPLLDSAMGELADADREAVLMRYFQNLPLREVGESLGVSEDAARKRVSRAVDRLRGWFAERGIAFTAGALVAGLSSQAVEAAPAGLATSTLQAVSTHSATVAASTTTTSLLTTMASTKLAALSAALIGAAIPISLAYMSPEQGAGNPVVAPLPAAPSALDVPGSADSELIAEWKRMRAQFGPAVGSMPELYGAVKAIGDDFRRRAFRAALLAEWVALDGAGAVEFLEKHDKGRLEQVFASWLESDPDAAIATLRAGGSRYKDYIREHLEAIAAIDAQALPELAAHVERRQVWDEQVMKSFAVFARSDLEASRAMAVGMGGEAGAEALAGVASVWGERDGPAAFDWVQSIGDEKARGRAMQGLLVGWAKSDPMAALERIRLAPPGGNENSSHNTASQVIAAAAEKDFDLAVDWLSKTAGDHYGRDSGFEGLDGVLQKRFMQDVAGTLDFIRNSPAQQQLGQVLHGILLNDGFAERDAVWEWLGEQPASDFTEQLRSNLLRSAAWKNPEVALEWIESLPDQGEVSERSADMANALLNGGGDNDRLDGLLEQVTDGPLRRALLQVGLQQPDPNIDVPKWLSRLEEIPVAERSPAIGVLANSWSKRDPAAAFEWAAEIESAAERNAAYTGAVEGWAGADTWEASRWVAELPQGAERDHSIIGLVRQIGASEPDAAWEWANAASAPEQRDEAVVEAIRALVPIDPALAQQRLDASPTLPENARDGLAQDIEFQRSRR